jgi:O-antigen ligase
VTNRSGGKTQGRKVDIMVLQGEGKLGLSPLFFLCAWTLVCSFLLGGGAANVYLTNSLVQLLALPALVGALWRLVECGPPRTARPALYLLGAGFLLVLLQLIPMPPGVWSSLPFRDKAAAAFAALGDARRWAPLSLTPEATIVGALTNIAPVALFLGVMSLNLRERRLLTLIVLAFGLINAFVGLLQLSQGQDSPLYLYRYGGTGDSVGLFANRNHEAALLYSLAPFAAAWIGGLAPAVSIRDRRGKSDATTLIKLMAAGVTLFVLIVATLMARSRAGVILLMVALLGGLTLQPWRTLREGKSHAGGVFVVIAVMAMMLGLQYGLYKILMRFEADPFADARIAIGRVTAQATLKALPFGTGLGSFAPLYASIERPSDVLLDRFVNLAHNDPLEFVLEAGAPGAALMLGFFLWFLARCRDAWRGGDADRARGSQSVVDALRPNAISVDVLMVRAATISIALLLVHSLVDYPLRTNALMGLFAFCCALLIPPGACNDATGIAKPTTGAAGLRRRGALES